jgi:hypothetical protein
LRLVDELEEVRRLARRLDDGEVAQLFDRLGSVMVTAVCELAPTRVERDATSAAGGTLRDALDGMPVAPRVRREA